MIETPSIVQSTKQLAAVIHLTIPRADIQKEMGPAYKELMAAVSAQGIKPTGPWFSHHFKTGSGDIRFRDRRAGAITGEARGACEDG